MKKKTRNIIIALIVLLLLVGAYFLITALTREEEEDTSIPLTSCEQDDIEQIEYTKGEDCIKLVKKDGEWVYAEDESFPLNTTKVDSMAQAIAELTATRNIGKSDDLSEYGLASPDIVVTASTVDGEVVSFSVGAENSLSGGCYVMLEGDENVYLASSTLTTTFGYELMGLGKAGSLPEELEDSETLSVKITNEAGEYELTTPVTLATYYEGYKWQASTPTGDMLADSDAVNNIISEIESMDLVNLAAYNVDEQKLSELGFDKAIDIELKYKYEVEQGDEDAEPVYKEDVLRLSIAEKDENTYYVHLDGDTNVYSTASYNVNALLKLSEESLAVKEVCVLDYDSVDAMTVAYDGKTHEVAITRGEDEDTATLDGKSIGEVYIEGFFEDVIALESEGSPEKEGGKTLLKVSFRRNTDDEFAEMTLEIREYDSAFALASFAGRDNLINKRDVDSLISEFEGLFELAE